MIRSIKLFLASAVVALGFSFPAAAVTGGTDFTDLWFNPSEPGWGVNIIHQNGIIFATLFVYDAAGVPHFYTGSETRGTGNTFTGTLSESHGTYFATNPYNAGQWGTTTVGSITFNFTGPNSGTLSYNVGGNSVTKTIQRFAFGTDNLSGNYLGGMTASSVCGGANQLTLIFDTMAVSQSGNSFTATVSFFNGAGVSSRCTFSGSYTPMGRQGNVSGNYTCTFGTTPGNAGSFTISGIEATQNGFNGRFSGSDQFCSSHHGYFGGVRDVL